MTELQQRDDSSVGTDPNGTGAHTLEIPTPGSNRPTFFRSKARQEEEPQLKSLRLLLNKLTPGAAETQTSALLAFQFNQDLIGHFSTLILARVTIQRTLSTVLASSCFLLRESLLSKNANLADFFTASLTQKLEQATELALTETPEKFVGLLALTCSLTICEFCSADSLFKAMTKALMNPIDVLVEAVCSIFKSSMQDVLGVEDAKSQAEEVISRLSEIWHTNNLAKRTQFQVQDILDSKAKLLTPKPKPVPEAPVLRKRISTRARKRVTFPSDIITTPDSPPTPSDSSRIKSCPSSICRTNLSPSAKTKVQGIVRQVMEDHNISEASGSLIELLKTLDQPAVSELVLQLVKYMLLVMSRNEYQDVCLVVQHLVGSTELLSKSEVEDGCVLCSLHRIAESINDILLDNPRAKECMHETLIRLQDLSIITHPEDFEKFPNPVLLGQ